MFALVIFVCYLQGNCEHYVVDILPSEQQCLNLMHEQRIRRGGCYPLDATKQRFWHPAERNARW